MLIEQKINQNCLVIIFSLLFFILLTYNTGFYGDDFSELGRQYFLEVDESSHVYPLTFISYYQHFWVYSFFDVKDQNIVVFLKVFYLTLSTFFLMNFFEIYFSKKNSYLLSLIIIAYPMHDTTIYWFMTVDYYFISSLILLSYVFLKNNKRILAHLCLTISTFSFLGCVPFFISLCFLSYKEKEKYYKVYFFYIVLFFLFYYVVSQIIPTAQKRINLNDNSFIIYFIKNNFIWLVSLIDSQVGLNAFFKIYESLSNLRLYDLIIASFFSIFLILFFKPEHFDIDKKLKNLIISFIILIFFSSAMYSLSGTYFNSSFNFTNRTNYNSSFLLVLLIFFILNKLRLFNFFIFLFFCVSFGLSSHWKDFNGIQLSFLQDIKVNKNFSKITKDDFLFSYGLNYSQLGRFKHIDFLRMEWVCQKLYKNQVSFKHVRCVKRGDSYNYKKNEFISKQDNKVYDLSDIKSVYIYKIYEKKLYKISKKDLTKEIEYFEKSDKLIPRIWLQLNYFDFVYNFLKKLT